MFPKKSWRDYPVHSSQKTAGTIQSTLPKKNPGRTIQSTVPKKTLEGLSSPQFPKKPCRDYPVHNSQKKPCRDYPVHTSPKKSWRDYPVHSSQKNPGGTIQSTVPKKTLQGLSSPHFPKKSWRDYPVHSFQKKILMLFHHLQAWDLQSQAFIGRFQVSYLLYWCLLFFFGFPARQFKEKALQPKTWKAQ